MCQKNKPHLKRQVQSLPTLWKIPDPMWSRIQALLPDEKTPGTPGRPPVPFRTVLTGILYVLRTGCQWKAVPRRFSSGSTLHRRFQQWVAAGLFEAIIATMLRCYDNAQGIAWRWQAIDTKLAPEPLGGEKTGRNPTDRGKSGTKRHLLIDGRGVPLSFYLSGANRHDLKGLRPLLEAPWLTERPNPSASAPQHLCLDKAYDAASADALLAGQGYIGHIKRQGEKDEPGVGEPFYPARRWKAERSISWMNNMRKLRVRWEKKAANYEALWLFAAALLIYRRIVLG